MSGLRCWPGCLAVQVRAMLPENVGITVEVVRLAGKDHDGPLWEVKTARPVRGVHTLFGHIVPRHVPGFRQVAPDAWLRPITPPPGAESTTTDADKPVEQPA